MVRRSCLLLLAACCRSAGQAGRSDENVCDGSSQRTATEVLSFFADALGGSKTRGESLEEADTLTRDLEHRCTPKLAAAFCFTGFMLGSVASNHVIVPSSNLTCHSTIVSFRGESIDRC